MNAAPIRVVKLGGSLLDEPQLLPRLKAWLAQQPAGVVLVVGGGAMADAIRAADRIHGLNVEAAHWLCIRAMSVNAHLTAELLPESKLASDTAEVMAVCRQGGLAILDPWPFVRKEDQLKSPAPLPCSWDATSDSIAARLATRLAAPELVLLKSTLPPLGTDLKTAANDGYVDPYFPTAAADLRVIRCIDLRSDAPAPPEATLWPSAPS